MSTSLLAHEIQALAFMEEVGGTIRRNYFPNRSDAKNAIITTCARHGKGAFTEDGKCGTNVLVLICDTGRRAAVTKERRKARGEKSKATTGQLLFESMRAPSPTDSTSCGFAAASSGSVANSSGSASDSSRVATASPSSGLPSPSLSSGSAITSFPSGSDATSSRSTGASLPSGSAATSSRSALASFPSGSDAASASSSSAFASASLSSGSTTAPATQSLAYSGSLQRAITEVFVNVLRDGHWTRKSCTKHEIAFSSTVNLSREQLEESLRLNDQFVPEDEIQMIMAVIEGRLSGPKPKCLCGAHSTVRGETLACLGIDGKMCQIMIPRPNAREWLEVPTVVDNCPFEVIVRKKKGEGWYIDTTAVRFCPYHSDGCSSHARSTGAVAKSAGLNLVQPSTGHSLPRDTILAIAAAQGAAHLSFSTITRTIALGSAQARQAHRAGQFKLVEYVKRLAEENPSSRVILMTRNAQNLLVKREYIGNEPCVEHYYGLHDDVFRLGDAEENWFIQDLKRAQYDADHVEDATNVNRSAYLLQAYLALVEKHKKEFQSFEDHWRGHIGGVMRVVGVNTIHLPIARSSYDKERSCLLSRFAHEERELLQRLERAGCRFDSTEVNAEKPAMTLYGDEEIEFASLNGVPRKERIVSICFIPGQLVQYAKAVGCNVFCIDGTHMKDGVKESGSKGQLLTCFTMDGFNMILPLGFCYCFSENHANLKILVDSLCTAGLEMNHEKAVVMSDRSRAAFCLMRRTLVKSRHRWCQQHLIRNIRSHLRRRHGFDIDETNAISAAFEARTRSDFEVAMEELERQCRGAYTYLRKLDIDCWASFTFVEASVPTWGITSNNAVEQGAWSLMKARQSKTIISMLREIEILVYRNLLARKKVLLRMRVDENLLPFPAAKIAQAEQDAGGYVFEKRDVNAELQAQSGTHGEQMLARISSSYRVYRPSEDVLSHRTVSLKTRTCSCDSWQDLGYPCCHVLAARRDFNDVDYHLLMAKLYAKRFMRFDVQILLDRIEIRSPNLEEIPSGAQITQPSRDRERVKRGRPAKETRMRSIGE